MLWPVFEFRTLYELEECYRYNNGQWTKDDGEYDIAFIGLWKGIYPSVVYIELPYYENILWEYCDTKSVAAHPNGNPWHYMLRPGKRDWGRSWRERYAHPNMLAEAEGRERIASVYSVCNGMPVTVYNVMDPHVLLGMIREVGAKKVVRPPRIFNCMYCGTIDISSKLNRLKAELIAARLK